MVMMGGVLVGEPPVAGGNDGRCAGRGITSLGGKDWRCSGRGTPAPSHLSWLYNMHDR
jgi:hypothetical protein